MDSIAEVTTPYCVALYRFNDEDPKDVETIQELISELADDGLVCAIEFYTSQ